jgi:hypothetical protein
MTVESEREGRQWKHLLHQISEFLELVDPKDTRAEDGRTPGIPRVLHADQLTD